MKKELLKTIPFEKDWEDLTDDNKADFLSVIGVPLMNESNEATIMTDYKICQMIIDLRGIDNLPAYFKES